MAETSAPSPVRLLLALNEREQAAFFPQQPLAAQLPPGFEVRNTPPAPGDPWQPDVMVGAWSTPPLPVPADGGLPVRYYCHLAGAVRQIVPRELISRGLLVTNWGHSTAPFVAEAALTLTLAGLRQLPRHEQLRREGGWVDPRFVADSLFGKRVGLYGFGAVAQQFAGLIAPFRPQVRTFDPFASPADLDRCGALRMERLEDLFAASDVLVIACALNAATRGSVTAALLDRLPAGALLVNVARGQVVDETALVDRARAGRLRAALDVFEREPLAADSPLRASPDVVVTPHVAGNTREARATAVRFAVANLLRFAHGERLEAQIDLTRYDRMT